jgi:hypothetical protein
MTHAVTARPPGSLLGHLLDVLRTATLERMVLPDVEGKEIDERILLESHLVRTPEQLFASQKPPFL